MINLTLVAFERYRGTMQHADLQLEQMNSWDLRRAYFLSEKVEMAFVMRSPTPASDRLHSGRSLGQPSRSQVVECD
ncbi:MAG: hypothetical protein GY946_07370 [bacterium]|nr:hypothetical protein [bacterium]